MSILPTNLDKARSEGIKHGVELASLEVAALRTENKRLNALLERLASLEVAQVYEMTGADEAEEVDVYLVEDIIAIIEEWKDNNRGDSDV